MRSGPATTSALSPTLPLPRPRTPSRASRWGDDLVRRGAAHRAASARRSDAALLAALAVLHRLGLTAGGVMEIAGPYKHRLLAYIAAMNDQVRYPEREPWVEESRR
jgi:hypothetical protein